MVLFCVDSELRPWAETLTWKGTQSQLATGHDLKACDQLGKISWERYLDARQAGVEVFSVLGEFRNVSLISAAALANHRQRKVGDWASTILGEKTGAWSGALSGRTPTVTAVDLPLNICQQINGLPHSNLITKGVQEANNSPPPPQF